MYGSRRKVAYHIGLVVNTSSPDVGYGYNGLHVSLSVKLSLRLKGYFSVLVVSYFVWSGA